MPDGTLRSSALLTTIGTRVRAARKISQLSRKALAERSGVSERHLAQLETGTGNISILLLDRICSALGVQMSNLVAAPRNLRNVSKSNRVALIGLRGAGKSTLGTIAAQQLGVPFLELNELISEEAGLSPPEIFAIYGEDGYRRLEAKVLKELATRQDPVILTTGGGIVDLNESYDLLLSRFHTVWLSATPEEHMARVKAQGDERPMTDDSDSMNTLRDILDSRNAHYRRADAHIDTAHRPIEDCAHDLIELAQPWVKG